MSLRLRQELEEEAFKDLEQLELGFQITGRRKFVSSAGADVQSDRSWDFFAYSYGQAFESLWDAAYKRPSEVLNYPLLSICRQSIELSLKSAIDMVLQSDPPNGHKLKNLWSKLLAALSDKDGMVIDAWYRNYPESLIEVLDAHDQKGDRFRYPTDRNHVSYASTEASLKEMYRAHLLITSFCDSVCEEIRARREVSSQSHRCDGGA